MREGFATSTSFPIGAARLLTGQPRFMHCIFSRVWSRGPSLRKGIGRFYGRNSLAPFSLFLSVSAPSARVIPFALWKASPPSPQANREATDQYGKGLPGRPTGQLVVWTPNFKSRELADGAALLTSPLEASPEPGRTSTRCMRALTGLLPRRCSCLPVYSGRPWLYWAGPWWAPRRWLIL